MAGFVYLDIARAILCEVSGAIDAHIERLAASYRLCKPGACLRRVHLADKGCLDTRNLAYGPLAHPLAHQLVERGEARLHSFHVKAIVLQGGFGHLAKLCGGKGARLLA